MRGRIRHHSSKNFCQYIKSLYCRMRHILPICHLVTFRIPTTETSIQKPLLCWNSGLSFGRDKTGLQHSRKLFPGLLQRPPKTQEATYRCVRKLFRRPSLAPEFKYTILIFIPSESEISGHRLYVCLYIYILVYFSLHIFTDCSL